jgi:hypothetical protein
MFDSLFGLADIAMLYFTMKLPFKFFFFVNSATTSIAMCLGLFLTGRRYENVRLLVEFDFCCRRLADVVCVMFAGVRALFVRDAACCLTSLLLPAAAADVTVSCSAQARHDDSSAAESAATAAVAAAARRRDSPISTSLSLRLPCGGRGSGHAPVTLLSGAARHRSANRSSLDASNGQEMPGASCA